MPAALVKGRRAAKTFATTPRRSRIEFMAWIVAALAMVGAALVAAAATARAFALRQARAREDMARSEATSDAWRREVARRNRELEALNAVAAVSGRGADLALTAEQILEVVGGLTRMPVGGVHRFDRASDTLVLLAQRGLTPEAQALMRVRPVGEAFTGEVVRTGRFTVVSLEDSPPADPRLRELAHRLGHRTQLSLPIMVEGETWGTLTLVSSERATFDSDDLQLLEAVTQQVGRVVERAALLVEMGEKTRRFETLTRLAQRLTSSLSPEEVLQTVVTATRSIFPDAAVRLWLSEGQALVLGAEAGVLALDTVPAITRLAFGEGFAGHAALTREAIAVEDMLGDPRAGTVLGWVRAQGFASTACLPLLARERLLGVLGVLTRVRHRFSADEMSALLSFANQAAIAMENARLFVEAQQRAAEYRALFEVGGLVGSTLDRDRVLDVISERCRALLGVAACGVFRLEPESGLLVYERGMGLSPEFIRTLRVRLGEGTTGIAVADRRPVWSADLLADPEIPLSETTRTLVAREHYRSVLSVPIVIGGGPYGAMAVYWWERHVPRASEIELMRALAGQAALALDSARLYLAAANRGRRLATLATVAGVVTSTLSLEEVFQRVVQSAVDLFGSSVSRLWLVDEGGETLSLRAVAGATSPVAGRTRFVIGEGLMGHVVATRSPLIVDDLSGEPRVQNVARIRAEGVVSFAGVPLVLGDRVLGALSIATRDRRPFSEEDRSLLQSLSSQAAIAIENARLFREATGQAAQLRALADLGRTLTSTFEVDRIVELVGNQARETLGVDRVGICLHDPARGVLRFVAGEGFPPEFVDAFTLEPGEGAAGRAFAENRPVWTSNFLEDPTLALRPESRERAARQGGEALLAVPLVRERPVGALVVTRAAGYRFPPAEVEYLSVFASQVAVALENARLYAQTTRRLAETSAVLEVVGIFNSTLEPTRLLRQVAIKIAQVCRVDRCTIERWDGDRMVPVMSQFADGRRDDRLWRAFVETLPTRAPRDVPAYARAIDTRAPVVIDDTATSDLLPRDWIETYSHRSYLVTPLIRQDQVFGVMNLDYTERATPFQPWQVDLAQAIAGQLALSLENSRLYMEAQQRLHETSALVSVGRALSRPGPPVEVMRHAVRAVARALGADMGGIYALTPAKDALVPVAGYRIPAHLLETLTSRPFVLARFPALLESWRSGRAAWSSDVTDDPRFDHATFEGIDPHSVLFAPTPVRGEPFGGLFLVWWGTGRPFQADEVRLVEALAGQVGLAMENLELARQTQARLAETETLLAVSRTLSSTLDLETMPREFLRHVVRALGADGAGMWLLDESGEWLEPLAGYHVPRGILEAYRRLRISIVEHAFYAEAARTRRCVVSTDVRNDSRMPPEVRAHQQTQLFVPIVSGDRMVGGYAVTWWQAVRRFSESELALAEAVASQSGAALENARLFRANQRRLEELSVLHELSRAVTGQLDEAGLIETIHQQVARVLDVGHLVILLRDPERDELEVALRIIDGHRDDGPPRRYVSPAVGLMSVVLRTGRPVRTAQYWTECARRGVAPVAGHPDLRHWLGVPMTAGDRVLGVVGLRSRDRAFTEADQRVLANIADLGALALRSARLYEERTRAYGELAAAQDQLVRTEKLRALGEMASGIAHDFNNVLAAIVGRAQLLLQEVRDPRFLRWLEVIERSALDGAQTVRRLQEFTRIRRDQPFVAVDLNRVVQEALEVTEARWREEPRRRGIALEVRTALAPLLPAVAGDPAELREGLTNLILNALDAMPAGGLLTLATGPADGEVELAVTDTGVGIPEHLRSKIFDPFFTTKGPSGTGLGLSMTYGILSRHGARMSVESAEGQGTTFRLRFPPSSEVAGPGPDPEPPPEAGPLRCLVVDDEPMVGDVLGDVLMSAGHSAVVLRDGEVALSRFRESPFDVVFTDLSMPGLSGWDVARGIRAVTADVPVFLVTGFGVEVSPDELGNRGIDAVLAKPLRIQDVLSVLAGVRSRADD